MTFSYCSQFCGLAKFPLIAKFDLCVESGLGSGTGSCWCSPQPLFRLSTRRGFCRNDRHVPREHARMHSRLLSLYTPLCFLMLLKQSHPDSAWEGTTQGAGWQAGCSLGPLRLQPTNTKSLSFVHAILLIFPKVLTQMILLIYLWLQILIFLSLYYLSRFF